jgi:hypothetical protein
MSLGSAMRALVCIALVMLSLPWGGTPPARAQEAIGAGIAENIAAGRSATDFSSRLRIRTGYLSLPGDPWLVPTRLSGTYAPHPSVALRLSLPLVYADPGTSGGEFGTSDLSARVLWRAWNHPRAAAFVGLEFFFPTASDPLLGTEKYSLAPTAALFFQILDNVWSRSGRAADGPHRAVRQARRPGVRQRGLRLGLRAGLDLPLRLTAAPDGA